jgi:uncharacterized protein YecE (DUF72 family)
LNFYIGCSGWSYGGWKGTFYPKDMESKDYLSYYSKFFNFVEVDSTYYNIPSRFAVRAWKNKTPFDFKFTIKFPKIITHEKKLEDVSKPLSIFFNALEPLIDKILLLLIQLPPYLSVKKGFESLQTMTQNLDTRFRYALEVRHSSWFEDKIYDFLKDQNMSMVWSVRDELTTPTVVTADQIYTRFIGDRSINEKDFGRVVKDRTTEMIEYARNFKNIQNAETNVRDVLIAFNNHFAGFGPQSVNDFLKIMNKSEKSWKSELESRQLNSSSQAHGKYQSSLSDFSKFHYQA